jgi:ATP-dependent exoDNAse (exonuclease V) alpha subunit
MVQRELLYTACTRAREELYVICEPDHFTKGILNQRIKGNTLEEKAVYFRGKSVTNQSEI